MKNLPINVGIVGTGYIGESHIEALRRLPGVRLRGITDVNRELAAKKAEQFDTHLYSDINEMLEDPEMDAIHNCTPNNLHQTINEQILRAGKHLFSEKPLARNSAESAALVALAAQYPELVAVVNFNYRFNPLVLEMRSRIAAGEIGEVRLAHGAYLQDWLLYDTDYNWRLESEICGISRCVADIGSHWMDMVQFLTCGKIVEVCADTLTVFPFRKKPRHQTETFSESKDDDYELRPIDTEDWSSVLFGMDNGVRGVFYVSEISAGHGCGLKIEIDGSKASLAWNQERADELWVGERNKDNCLLKRNPNSLSPEARRFSYLAKGHPEGWNDAFRNSLANFYLAIRARRDGDTAQAEAALTRSTSLDEAHYIILLTEAIIRSAKERRWVSLK